MVGVEFLVGGWFASPVIKIVLEKAQKYLGANYKWQKGGEEMVEELTRSLLLCQATVQEVEKITIINNSALADLLRSLKDTAYDAEDVLDNIETKSIKDEVEGKTKNKGYRHVHHAVRHLSKEIWYYDASSSPIYEKPQFSTRSIMDKGMIFFLVKEIPSTYALPP